MSKQIPALKIEQLTCMAGYRPLFSDINTSLGAGQWMMLTGPNGTGKTTFLRAIAGLARPESGTITWQGETINPQARRWRHEIHYLGHSDALKSNLSARDNLALWISLDGAASASKSKWESQADELLKRVGLSQRRDLPAAQLSAGQKRRIQLARLMTSQRRLWLLDEPGNALDSEGDGLLGQLIDSHLSAGGCVVVATHQPLATPVAPILLDIGSAGSQHVTPP